ncbi:tripartite motif-containing protein 6 isoform X2 [Marmota monax]|uniref:tripartite motif-containing protein 6 isoform X2 n=1 Tax=Marmota monax TaxID=9995 RepID=UPI001EAFCC4F|nr:tripartite motif-containing protein 6 isoform X2 [Marmota monax]XP_048644151.1 tripartite motif-containing protein 6 isoform X2 [Marmota marmota marmota]
MTSTVLGDIRDEVTCPLCLELLTEPVSTDCGHSFCQACITENREESEMSQDKERNCPVCQTSYQPRNLRPNRHLANIAQRLREVVLCPGKQLQEMFQESLKKLRKEQQEAEKLRAFIKEKRASWKTQMEPERQRIQTEFSQLRSILDKEEQRELKKLEEEERKGLSIIEKAEEEVIYQSQSLEELISNLEHRCQGSVMDLLQDVSDVMQRSEFWTLRDPPALPTKLRSMFRAPDLKKMLRVFRELTDVQSYWVDVTMNPHTANLNLVLSKNRRQVRFVGTKLSETSCLEEHHDFSVLGSQQFSSGKYYWEVDVTRKTAWILGVCSNSMGPAFSGSQFANKQNAYSRYQPQTGYWVIGLQHKHEYRAYEDASTSLLLSMTVPPRRVGVFLDYEAGTVSFYNVTNHGLPIYTFTKYYFPTAVCPYFNPCDCVVPMTLRRPSS